VRTDGTVLDPGGFPISTAAGNQTSPVVAYYGPHYLVVWDDSRWGEADHDIYGSAVTTAGQALDTGGAPFSIAPGDQRYPAIVSEGPRGLVVWSDGRAGAGSLRDIWGTRWDSTTVGVQDPAGLAISTAAQGQDRPAVTSYGSGYLVAWEDNRIANTDLGDIYGARVTAAGAVLDPAGVPLATGAPRQLTPSLAFDGTYALVAWTQRTTSSGPWDLRGARWDPAAGVIDVGGLAISTAGGDQHSPAVTVNGGFLVLWTDTRRGLADVYGARVATNGTVKDPDGFFVTSGGFFPGVTKGPGSKSALTYDRNGDIFFATVSPK
jgi:hypothetical protein